MYGMVKYVMHVCMYAGMRMHVCMYECMYAFMHVCMYAGMRMRVCMYGMYACMNVCMHLCMYACMHVYSRMQVCLHLRSHCHVTWLFVAKQLARFVNIDFLDTCPNNSNNHTKPNPKCPNNPRFLTNNSNDHTNPNCPNNPRFLTNNSFNHTITLNAQITQGFWLTILLTTL